jgi:hypothetical protein
MKHPSSAAIMPCMSFFLSGRPALGVLTLLMQISLLLWPTAARWAKEVQEQDNIKQLLEELSETYRPALVTAAGPAYPAIAKKFQQPA